MVLEPAMRTSRYWNDPEEPDIEYLYEAHAEDPAYALEGAGGQYYHLEQQCTAMQGGPEDLRQLVSSALSLKRW